MCGCCCAVAAAPKEVNFTPLSNSKSSITGSNRFPVPPVNGREGELADPGIGEEEGDG